MFVRVDCCKEVGGEEKSLRSFGNRQCEAVSCKGEGGLENSSGESKCLAGS